jgi:hypothetical protein
MSTNEIKTSLQQVLPVSEAEMQGLLQPAEASQKERFTNVTVTKTVTPKGLQTIRRSTSYACRQVARKDLRMQLFHAPEMLRSVWQEIDYRPAALPVEVAMNKKYHRQNSVCLLQYDSSKYCLSPLNNFICFQNCKALFEIPCISLRRFSLSATLGTVWKSVLLLLKPTFLLKHVLSREQNFS